LLVGNVVIDNQKNKNHGSKTTRHNVQEGQRETASSSRLFQLNLDSNSFEIRALEMDFIFRVDRGASR
jgi:hypothetical protein